jgi:hypothetical protein
MYRPNILKLPNGKYTFVGSLPEHIMTKIQNHIGQIAYNAPVFDTYEQAKTFFESEVLTID